ncbi:MAG: hypothetical protein WBW73_06160 [Rhodoplanes sp.]
MSRPQQEPIPWLVFATITIRPDMRSFESRQGPLLRDSAAPMVDVRDQHAEGTLTKPGADEVRLAKSRAIPCDDRQVKPV